MKRFSALILALLMMLSVLCGCEDITADDIQNFADTLSYYQEELNEETVSSGLTEESSSEEVVTEPAETTTVKPTPAPTTTTTTAKKKTEKQTKKPTTTTAKAKKTTTVTKKTAAAIDENGYYTSPKDVAKYLRTYKHLPKNYITKAEAEKLGWVSSEGNLWKVTDKKSIGGDRFGNREGRLPDAKGRKWYECDVNYNGGFRGGERLVYSNDGLIYYTKDHYKTFTLMEDTL